jgi:hypothetical protein
MPGMILILPCFYLVRFQPFDNRKQHQGEFGNKIIGIYLSLCILTLCFLKCVVQHGSNNSKVSLRLDYFIRFYRFRTLMPTVCAVEDRLSLSIFDEVNGAPATNNNFFPSA